MYPNWIKDIFKNHKYSYDIVSRFTFGCLFIDHAIKNLYDSRQAEDIINSTGIDGDLLSLIFSGLALFGVVLIVTGSISKNIKSYVLGIATLALGVSGYKYQILVNIEPGVQVLAGILLILGLFTRISSVYLIAMLLHMKIATEIPSELLMSNNFIISAAFIFLVIASFIGSGKLSLDYMITKRVVSDTPSNKKPIIQSLFKD